MSARASRRRSASEKNKAVNLLIRVLLTVEPCGIDINTARLGNHFGAIEK